ncbi:MAG TPA: response regulator [Rhodocyclaceae bacterium]|jgi:putative two-component system response regulator|nr:response regulator [Rhodocyclaceae bacterium]
MVVEGTLGAAKKPIVLVIDDTPDNLSLMSELLCEHYEVKVANNGRRGLRIATSDAPPALILLDIMMPDMDGYAVCRELKASTQTRDIPVVFITTLDSIEDEKRGFALGAIDYISKPVDPVTVLERIGNHLVS